MTLYSSCGLKDTKNPRGSIIFYPVWLLRVIMLRRHLLSLCASGVIVEDGIFCGLVCLARRMESPAGGFHLPVEFPSSVRRWKPPGLYPRHSGDTKSRHHHIMVKFRNLITVCNSLPRCNGFIYTMYNFICFGRCDAKKRANRPR